MRYAMIQVASCGECPHKNYPPYWNQCRYLGRKVDIVTDEHVDPDCPLKEVQETPEERT